MFRVCKKLQIANKQTKAKNPAEIQRTRVGGYGLDRKCVHDQEAQGKRLHFTSQSLTKGKSKSQ